MKKIMFLVALLAVFVLSGCIERKIVQVVDKDGKVIEEYDRPFPSMHLNPKCVSFVEGCEYFIVYADASRTYVHKGNCKNPIHIHNGGNHE